MTARRSGRASGVMPVGSSPTAPRRPGGGPDDHPAARLRSGHLLAAIVCALDEVFSTELKRLTASSPVRSFAKTRAWEVSGIGKSGFRAVLLVSEGDEGDCGTDVQARPSMPSTLELDIYGCDGPVRASVSPAPYSSGHAQKPGSTLIRRADFACSAMDLAILVFRD